MLGAFAAVLLKGASALKRAEGTRAAVYVGAGMIALLIMMQFESYNATVFYVPLALLFYSEDFAEEGRGDCLKA